MSMKIALNSLNFVPASTLNILQYSLHSRIRFIHLLIPFFFFLSIHGVLFWKNMFHERDCIFTYVYLKERERTWKCACGECIRVCVPAFASKGQCMCMFCFISILRLCLFSAFRAWCKFHGCTLCILEVLLCFSLIRFHIFIALAEDEGSLRRKARCYM